MKCNNLWDKCRSVPRLPSLHFIEKQKTIKNFCCALSSIDSFFYISALATYILGVTIGRLLFLFFYGSIQLKIKKNKIALKDYVYIQLFQQNSAFLCSVLGSLQIPFRLDDYFAFNYMHACICLYTCSWMCLVVCGDTEKSLFPL